MSTQGHYLNNLGRLQYPMLHVIFQGNQTHWFERRRFVKVFTMNRHCDYVGHVTSTIGTNFSSLSQRRGGWVVRWCWVNFHCRGVLLIWIRVGQGPTALAVGAGGGCLDVFSLIYHFFSFFLPLSGRRSDID